ncbi:MAG: glucose-6-phosphate dehydrogenase [Deltaproteobacteria bacterium]|nr:glucose-6-phosphate dehydrogenase [Deltaproteobacteria bacterium]
MAEADERNIRTLSLGRTTPQPNTLVIFGAAGDLTRRKLLPAVWNLKLDGLLPENFAVVGFTRRDWDDQTFREGAREAVAKYSRRKVDAGKWPEFEKGLFHSKGAFDDPAAYAELKRKLDEIDRERGIPGNRVYYLSIPPSTIATCVEELQRAGLVESLEPDRPFTRIIVEKPIGHDLESARRINDDVARVFDERQVFRIDHYLGKETVQSILVLRFANSIFEPLWNQKYIDHVQITVSEEEGVGTRAGYYEEAGALRDMVQNHILQLLCLTAMEPPWSMSADVVRDQKMGVLNCLRTIPADEVDKHVVRAQYGPGKHGGNEVPGYRREDRVKSDSTTETYVAIKAWIDNWRWAGVPFYLRTGKALPQRASEIAIQFKPVPSILFNAEPNGALEPNVLVLRIQPDEGLSLQIATKAPGPRVRISPVQMDFQYGEAFRDESPEAYERLLLDVMAGDATLFMRRDAVEASWAWVTGILDAWKQGGARWLPEYAAGSWGPVEADRMIQNDGRRWREL